MSVRFSWVGRVATKLCPACRAQEKWDKLWYEVASPILCMELEGGRTYNDCLIAAASIKGLPDRFIGPLAQTLYGRIGRGEFSLEFAVELVRRRIVHLEQEGGQ